MSRIAGCLALLLLGACGAEPRGHDPKPADARPASGASADEVRGPAPLAASTARSSRFTTLDETKCRTTYRDEETGDWAGLCPGLGPISLELSSGDLRDDLTIIRGKRETALQIPTLVADGAFDSIGKTLEWRGPEGKEPDVLVARVHVARPDGTSDSGRLTIARLEGTPCIVAVVPPQAGQSDKARAIADGTLPACLEN